MGVSKQTECNIRRYCTLSRLILHVVKADIARCQGLILHAEYCKLIGCFNSNHSCLETERTLFQERRVLTLWVSRSDYLYGSYGS